MGSWEVDADRRQSVILFLYESGLISKGSPVINLETANLRSAILVGNNMRNVDLSGAELIAAALQYSDLQGANLTNANLGNAHLTGADLRGADLSGAQPLITELCNTKLDGANLSGVDVSAGPPWCKITQEQIDRAYGDESTKIPGNLKRPESWTKSIDEQSR